MRKMRILMAAVAIAPIVILSGCFPSIGDIIGGGGGGAPASVSGKWSIMLTSRNGSSNNVDLEANFSQATGTISAAPAVILSSSPCDAGTDSIDGTVKSNSITFTLAFGGTDPVVTFSGSVSTDGLTMAGSYKLPKGSCSPADSGTWLATKFGDSSGTYSGPLTSAVTGRTFNLSAVVQEDATNDLLVTANITGGACGALNNMTGQAIGSVLQFQTSDGLISFVTQASLPTFATMITGYAFTGQTCGTEDNGSGTLTLNTSSAVRSTAKTQITPEMHVLFGKARESLAASR
jgi:hypothetical protein